MKIEDKDTLYVVVRENEDDPYCAHWDDTVLITPDFSRAKNYCKESINKPFGYFPRIQEHSYNSKSKDFDYVKEYGMFGNGYMRCLNYENVKTVLKSFKGKRKIGTEVTVRYKISTYDVFLGEIVKEFESRYYIGRIDDSLSPMYWIWSDVFVIEEGKKIFLGTDKLVTTTNTLKHDLCDENENAIITGYPYDYISKLIKTKTKEMIKKGEI